MITTKEMSNLMSHDIRPTASDPDKGKGNHASDQRVDRVHLTTSDSVSTNGDHRRREEDGHVGAQKHSSAISVPKVGKSVSKARQDIVTCTIIVNTYMGTMRRPSNFRSLSYEYQRNNNISEKWSKLGENEIKFGCFRFTFNRGKLDMFQYKVTKILKDIKRYQMFL